LLPTHQYVAHIILEVADGALPVCLVLATVQAQAWIAALQQLTEQCVTTLLQHASSVSQPTRQQGITTHQATGKNDVSTTPQEPQEKKSQLSCNMHQVCHNPPGNRENSVSTAPREPHEETCVATVCQQHLRSHRNTRVSQFPCKVSPNSPGATGTRQSVTIPSGVTRSQLLGGNKQYVSQLLGQRCFAGVQQCAVVHQQCCKRRCVMSRA
jgi:hypothetical protein